MCKLFMLKARAIALAGATCCSKEIADKVNDRSEASKIGVLPSAIPSTVCAKKLSGFVRKV